MIEDPNNAANSLFAVYTNGSVQTRATVECEGQVLVPVSRGAEIFKHVRLPQGIQPYRSAGWLLAGVVTLILACRRQHRRRDSGCSVCREHLADRKRSGCALSCAGRAAPFRENHFAPGLELGVSAPPAYGGHHFSSILRGVRETDPNPPCGRDAHRREQARAFSSL